MQAQRQDKVQVEASYFIFIYSISNLTNQIRSNSHVTFNLGLWDQPSKALRVVEDLLDFGFPPRLLGPGSPEGEDDARDDGGHDDEQHGQEGLPDAAALTHHQSLSGSCMKRYKRMLSALHQYFVKWESELLYA